MSQSDNSVLSIYRDGNFNLEEISQLLKIPPDQTSIGDKNGKNTVWKLFTTNKQLHLEGQLENWTSLLMFKSNELKQLREKGWMIELDCLIHSDSGATIVSLDPELLLKLSKLYATLIIRVWD